MRLLTLITMILAWLSLSASAGITCPMGVPAPQTATISTHHHAGDAGRSTEAKPVHAKERHDVSGVSGMPYCAACLAMLPPLAIVAGAGQAFAYPAPSAAKALADLRPQPQSPPPRLA